LRQKGSTAAKTWATLESVGVKLIYRYGFDNMSLRMLAREANIEEGSLYYYIKSKRGFLFRLLKDTSEMGLESLKEEFRRTTEPDAQIRAFVTHFLNSVVRNRERVSISYSELRSLAPVDRREIRKLYKSYRGLVQEVIERGVARGVFKVPDARIATFAIIQMITGVTVWYERKGSLSMERLVEIYSELVLGTIGAGGSKTKREGNRNVNASNSHSNAEDRTGEG
jgi:AcrR family transcriptional regulator